jgi:hypothetical protein
MNALKNRGDHCHMGEIRASAAGLHAAPTLLRITFTVILRCPPKAALEGCTARAVALRGPLRGHLRVTENWP